MSLATTIWAEILDRHKRMGHRLFWISQFCKGGACTEAEARAALLALSKEGKLEARVEVNDDDGDCWGGTLEDFDRSKWDPEIYTWGLMFALPDEHAPGQDPEFIVENLHRTCRSYEHRIKRMQDYIEEKLGREALLEADPELTAEDLELLDRLDEPCADCPDCHCDCCIHEPGCRPWSGPENQCERSSRLDKLNR